MSVKHVLLKMLKKSKIDKYLLIAPLKMQEALQSSRMEGTRATFDEVLEFEINKNEKNNDAQEVLNYYEALEYGEHALSEIPISTRLFKRLHQILLSNEVRGKNKSPGEYLSIQNFIGPRVVQLRLQLLYHQNHKGSVYVCLI